MNVRVSAIQQSQAYKMLANNAPWEELSEGMKKTILYQHILDSTTSNFGTEIAQNTALLKGGFIAALSDARLALGQAFLPILNIALPLLTSLARAAETAFVKFAALMRALFPKANIKAGNAQTATIESQTAAVGSLGDAHEAAGDAATKASKDAKKAAGSLLGFDEVNLLKEPESAGGGADDAGAGMDAAGIDMTPYEDQTLGISEKVQEMADKIRSTLSGINFQPLIDSFNRLKAAIEPFTMVLFEGLKWFWDNILVPFGTWAIQSLIPAFLNALAGAFTVLTPLLKAFQSIGIWLWENFLQPIALWTGGIIVSVLNQLGTALTSIGTWMSNNQSTVTTITAALVGFFAAWKTIELMAFIQTSGGVAAAFTRMTATIWAATGAKVANMAKTAALTVMYAKDLVVSLASSAAALAKKTAAWVASTAAIAANRTALLASKALLIGDFIKAMATAAASLVTNAARWAASTTAMVANKVAMVASTVAQAAMTTAMIAWNAAAAIGTAATKAFNVAMAVLTSPITLVIAAVAALAAGIYLLVKNWDTVKETAATVWEGIKSVWSVAADWLKSNVVNPIANLFVGLFNGIIDGMNWVVRGLNKIKFEFPDWIPGVGGNSFGINIPEMPRLQKLARGGIVDGETNMGNYIAGEAGAEMIVPLENTSFVDKLAGALGTAVMHAMQFQQTGGQRNGDVVLNIDGVAIARAMAPYLAREQRRIGGNMIRTT
ncbi:hypothetical protein [Paenibacillus methanolicus]|uniref:hypothetical protein n=1 Tax=Paenibacillus methanolicus TaxID=582686 RepID=UPI0011E84544|nr:hypothetical protein [Paenibacillus methanolicus]